MPNGFNSYLINPASGLSLDLPTSLSPFIGLPPQPVDETDVNGPSIVGGVPAPMPEPMQFDPMIEAQQPQPPQPEPPPAPTQPQLDIPPPPPPVQAGAVPPEQAGMDLQRQGLQLQEQSVQTTAQADAAEADRQAAALAERNTRLEAERAETARQDAARQKRLGEIQGNVTKSVDDWANYKVDPGRRWKNASTGRKIGAAIAVAMTALGDALQRKSGPNLALEMIMKSIDDDVNLQVQERQHLGDVAQRTRTSLDDYRRDYGDWQQARSLKLAEEYKRTADEIERIAAKTKGDKAKANALAMVGELRGRAGALMQDTGMKTWNREMEQAKFAEQKRQARTQEGLAFAAHKQRESQFTEEMKFRREQLAAQQKSAADEYLSKASAEQARALRENGIKDPTTRQYIIGDDGQPIMERNATEGAKTQELLANTQTLLSTIDDIKGKIASDPGFQKLNATEKQAALQTQLQALALQLKESYTLGTLDKGSVDFLDKMTGGDPTKITAGGLVGALGLGADPGEKTAAKLDEIAKSSERRALNRLGNPKNFKFERAEQLQKTAANKAAEGVRKGNATVAEAVRAQEPGGIAKTLQDVESFVFGTKQQYKKDQHAAEESGGSLRYPGFRADKESALDVLVAGVQQGDAQSTTRLLEMVRDQKAPGLSDAAMTLIEAHAPNLIPQALGALPQDKRSLRQSIYAARNQASPLPWMQRTTR